MSAYQDQETATRLPLYWNLSQRPASISNKPGAWTSWREKHDKKLTPQQQLTKELGHRTKSHTFLMPGPAWYQEKKASIIYR